MKLRILAGRLDRHAGSHAYNLRLAQELVARGHEVSVIAFNAAEQLQGLATQHVVAPSHHGSAPLLWRLDSWRNYRDCARQLQALDLPPVDAVIAAEHLLLKPYLERWPTAPMIYLPHGLVADLEIRSYGLSPIAGLVSEMVYVHLQKWALQHAASTLRFTQHACRALESRYGARIRSPFCVNPMGTDVPSLSFRAPESTVQLLGLGRLIPGKRIDAALAALAGLTRYAWHFDIVGAGPSRPQLEAQVAAAGISDRVTFHGFQNEPGRWYAKADLLLFPSALENSPLTILEAMSHEVPCLAMRADGKRFHNANDEIVRDGTDGFLAIDDADFARQLESLLSAPARLRDAGRSARLTIERTHTWGRHMDRYDNHFNELLK